MTEMHLILKENEKKFIEMYQDLIVKHNGKEELINAVLPFIAASTDNYENLITILNDKIKAKLFHENYNKEYETPFDIKEEYINFLKEKDFNFTFPRVQFSFPKQTNYLSIKYRDKYLIASGDDGIIRIWLNDDKNDNFILTGEYGIEGNNKVNYELINEYLFYSVDKILYVYNIFSKKTVLKKEFLNEIEYLDIKDDKLTVYSKNILQLFLFEGNKLIGDLVDSYSKLPKKENLIEIKENIIIIDKGQILFTNKVITESKTVDEEIKEEDIEVENLEPIQEIVIDEEITEEETEVESLESVQEYVINEEKISEIVIGNKNKIISFNPILPIYGVQKIDDYLIIYYKNGNVLWFDKSGVLKNKFTIKLKSNDELIIEGLQQPKINFYALENDFIIEKDGFYFGSENWKKYLYFVETDKICLFEEGYDYYYDLITNNNLFNEI